MRARSPSPTAPSPTAPSPVAPSPVAPSPVAPGLVAALLVAALGLAACGPKSEIDLRFQSAALVRAVNDVRIFAFGPAGDSAPPPCERLDPVGLGPGDAPARTGLSPAAEARGKPGDPVATLPALAAGSYTLVVEGWGPACVTFGDLDNQGERPCTQTAPELPPILRAYACTSLKLERGGGLGTVVPVSAVAPLGSTLIRPQGVAAYDARSPAPVVDALTARDAFFVQALDPTGTPVTGLPVFWSVVHGAAFLDDAQPAATASQVIDAQSGKRLDGVARGVVHAGLAASTAGQGQIEVTAYAPGYDGAPISFRALAIGGVDVSIDALTLPTDEFYMGGLTQPFEPTVVDDLDGDGRTDIVLVAGQPGLCQGDGVHQIAILYGQADGTYRLTYSARYPGRVMTMKTARLSPGRRSLLVFTQSDCATVRDLGRPVPRGCTSQPGPGNIRARVAQEPRIEVWSGVDQPPPDAHLTAVPTAIGTAMVCKGGDCATVTTTRAVIAADVADIDGDGVDEIAVSRCSYLWQCTASNVDPSVSCTGELYAETDSEVAVLRVGTASAAAGGFGGFVEVATLSPGPRSGGVRGVQFGDVDGDGSLDLVFATITEVLGACGKRNLPGAGFGFAGNPARFAQPSTFSEAFSVVTGHFVGTRFSDVVVSAGLRDVSPNAGIKLLPGANCALDQGPDPLITGPRTSAREMVTRAADLNGDGFSDVLVLHRETREIETYFGSGTERLARGPTIALPASITGELDARVETGSAGPTTIAVTTSPEQNLVHLVRIAPTSRSH